MADAGRGEGRCQVAVNPIPQADQDGRAQAALDRIVNERIKDKEGGGSPICTVKVGLRDKVVSNEAELDLQLAALREKCLAQLKTGSRVRFEE